MTDREIARLAELVRLMTPPASIQRDLEEDMKFRNIVRGIGRTFADAGRTLIGRG